MPWARVIAAPLSHSAHAVAPVSSCQPGRISHDTLRTASATNSA